MVPRLFSVIPLSRVQGHVCISDIVTPSDSRQSLCHSMSLSGSCGVITSFHTFGPHWPTMYRRYGQLGHPTVPQHMLEQYADSPETPDELSRRWNYERSCQTMGVLPARIPPMAAMVPMYWRRRDLWVAPTQALEARNAESSRPVSEHQ